jgi:hypothetical protein
MDHIEQLENISIHILREAYANFKSLGMLWSIGKDSTVLLWLVRKAFFGHVPFPLIHIDTFYKIPEMIAYRDRLTREWKLNMIYGVNSEALESKQTYPDGNVDRITCCRLLKTEALKNTVSGDGPRYRYNHDKRQYELDTTTEPFTGIIAGVSGILVISRRNSGINLKPTLPLTRMCVSIPCSTGPNSISGSISKENVSPPCRSTITTGMESDTVLSGVIPVRSQSNRNRRL